MLGSLDSCGAAALSTETTMRATTNAKTRPRTTKGLPGRPRCSAASCENGQKKEEEIWNQETVNAAAVR